MATTTGAQQEPGEEQVRATRNLLHTQLAANLRGPAFTGEAPMMMTANLPSSGNIDRGDKRIVTLDSSVLPVEIQKQLEHAVVTLQREDRSGTRIAGTIARLEDGRLVIRTDADIEVHPYRWSIDLGESGVLHSASMLQVGRS